MPQLNFSNLPPRLISIVSLLLALSQLIAFAGSHDLLRSNRPSPVPASSAQILGLPMQFERNAGQTDSQVQFLSRGPGYTLFLTPTEAVLSLRSSSNSPSEHRAQDRRQRHSSPVTQTVMRMNLLGANPVAHIEATGNQSGTASYFIGQAPHQWHTGIPLFARVKYEQVYPGIDLVYYGNQRQLEYDFILAPRAAPEQIAIHFTGIDSLEIDSQGDLLAHLEHGVVRWHKPLAYQETSGGRQAIPAAFQLRDASTVGFQVSAAYDPSQSLVIDPSMLYTTYLGGSNNDYVCGIALDASGNIYLAGNTLSPNFPTKSAFRSTYVGSNDVFVAKFSNNGSNLLYSTYLGGTGNEIPGGLAVDNNGNAYVAGVTDSSDFPTRNAAYSANAGFNDAFIAKLGPFGTNLIYASYLGGNGDDSANAIAVDNSGHAYIAGDTFSIGTGNGPFPVIPHSAYQTHSGGGRDAFVAEFDTTHVGSASVIYSTFLGGSTDEIANGIAIDSSGNAYVVGVIFSYPTYPTPPSSDFPILNAFQSSFNQGNLDPLAGNSDAFLTKLNSTGTGLLFSTFLGGGDNDEANAITLDNSGRIYVMGETSSTNFPVLNAAQPVISGAEEGFPPPDAFISIFQSSGTNLYYSTYLGGSGYESGFETYHFGIAVDVFGDVYAAGYTDSLDFPLSDGADNTNSLGASDAFVTKINPAVPGPAGIVYSTLLGGDDNDRATGIAVDSSGNFYVAGFTSSTTNLATPNAFRGTNSGGYDVFLAKYTSPPDLSVSMIPSSEPVLVGSNVTYSIYINNNGRTTFTGVTNFVQFPTNTPILSITSSVGNWSTNAGLVTFNLGTMTNNAKIFQSITIHTVAPAVLTNVATLTSIETPIVEPNTDNNVSTVLTTVRGIADVTLSATSTPQPVLVSSNVIYTFTVINKGPYPATQAELVDVLPNTLTFVSATNTQGTCFFDGVEVVCDCNPLANNATATITVVAMTSTNIQLTNLASVAAFELDLNPNNNSASVVTTINPLADLALSQSGPAFGYVFSNATYTLTVTNPGPSATTNVVVTDVLPSGVSFVSASNPQGTASQTNGIVTCTISSLANNASATITITINPSVEGTVTNRATVTSGVTDPVLANNSASVTSVFLNAGQLVVSPQNLDFGTLSLGSNSQGTFVATNVGSVVITNVAVSISPGPFRVLSTPAFSLPGHGSANVLVNFNPTNTGTFSNFLTFVTSNGPDPINSVTGIGAQVPASAFTASPTNGAWSLLVTFTDNSTGTITNRFWDFGDGTTSNTTVTTVRHTYNAPGTNSVTLTATGPVGTNTLVRSGFIRVTNPPPHLVISPASLTFGQVVIGQTNTRTFQVTNSGGGIITGTATASLPFRIQGGSSPYTLTNGETRTVTVAFSPTNTGTISSSVVFLSNGGNSTNSVSGSGLTPPPLAVLPSSLDFGIVGVGNTSQGFFVLSNRTATLLTNGVASIASGPFVIVSGTPFSLPAFSTTNLVINFTPNSLSSFSNVVVVTTANGGSSTNPVTGIGSQPPAAAFAAIPTNGPWPLLVSFTDTSTGTISNRFWDFGDGSTTNTTVTNLTHTYFNPMSYSVTLTVSGLVGSNSLVRQGYILVTNPPAQLTISPLTLNFGQVVIGQTATRTLQLTNAGGGILAGSASTTLPFAIQSGSPFSLTNGETRIITVAFSPAASGSASNVVVFSSNGGGSTNRVLGVGLTPSQLSVSPLSWNFGPVAVGDTAQASFVVTNLGGAPLTNGVATISGAPAAFTILSGTPFSLPGFGSTNLVVSFSPPNTGSFSNAVLFTGDGGNSTNAITGLGVPPPQLGVLPSSLDFGTVAVGSTADASFVLTNRGGTALTNGTASLASGEFTIISGTPFSLPGFGSTNLVIRFAPDAASTFTNAVVVNTANGGGDTNSVTGIGAFVPQAAFSANPTSGLKPLMVTFTDSSTGTITNRFWDFGDGSTATITSTSFSHTYTDAGTYSVNLTVTGPVGTDNLLLSGYIVATNTPPQLTISPLSLDFGPVVIGQSSTQSFQIVNTGGLTLNGTVTASAPFAIESGSPYNLPPGQTGLVMVSFSPTSATNFSKLISFQSNGGNSGNSVNGVGLTPPQLSVLPASLDFGPVAVGSTAQATFIVTNQGGASLNDATALVGTGPFVVVSSTPFTLPGFGSSNLVISFTPGSVASFSNAVVVTTSNGGNSTNSVIGTGANPPAAAFTASPTNGLKPLTVTFTDSSTGTITNRFWDFGDGSTTNTTVTSFSHIYTAAGSFSVALTVTGPVGSDNLSLSAYISVTNASPLLTVSPSSLNFGPIVIGQSSTQSFQLVNNGGLTLNGTATASPPFAIESGSPYSLAPGQTGLVMTSFTPLSAATFSNVVVFQSNGGNSANSVTGVGLTPGQLGVLPPSLDFGSVAVGSSAQASFVITNRGGSALTNGTASVGAGPFAIVSGAPFTLPGFSSTNLVISFNPGTAAAFSNAVVVTTGNGGNSTNSVTGAGANPPTAAFTGSPTSGLKPLTVTFTDSSTGTITNRFWDFGDGSTTNTTVTSFTHIYTDAGTFSVILTVTGPLGSDDLPRSGYVSVTNAPPLLTVSPSSLNFGPIVIGQSSTQTFQLVNNGGLTLNGSASASPPFAIESGSPYSLAPGQTGLVMASFTPLSAATFSNVVVFQSNGGNTANSVTGIGLTPAQLGVLPPSLDFGAVAVGSSAQASFVITNRGGTALTNGTASVDAGPFAIVSGVPFTLPGFSSTNLVISFNPGTAASFSNVVVVSTGNGGNSTNPVTGVGANSLVASFTGSPTSGLKPLPVTFTDSSTGSITNRFWDFGDGVTTNTAATSLSHTYTDPNLYSVSLTISGPLGVSASTLTNYIVVTVQPRITDVEVSGANVIVSFTSSAGVSYSLDYTDALNPTAWNVAVSPIPGTGNVITTTHIGGATRKSRFYRISQLP